MNGGSPFSATFLIKISGSLSANSSFCVHQLVANTLCLQFGAEQIQLCVAKNSSLLQLELGWMSVVSEPQE